MALLLWLYAHIDECGIHTHELGTSASSWCRVLEAARKEHRVKSSALPKLGRWGALGYRLDDVGVPKLIFMRLSMTAYL